MALLIENPETIERIERRALSTGKTVDEVVAEALGLSFASPVADCIAEDRKASARRALRELQEAFKAHRDPDDHRTPDEIIGYDEHGLPN